MEFKLLLVALAILLSLVNYSRYLRKIFAGDFRPHMFSWAIWSLLSFISFAAQISKDAGPGMYQTAMMAFGTMVIAVVSWFKGERNYTRSDWIALIAALSAIPLWIATQNPLWSVILVTGIDAIATWPTIRKSWSHPEKESAGVFAMAALICALGFASLETLTFTTGLYQGAVALLNLILVLVILLRRKST